MSIIVKHGLVDSETGDLIPGTLHAFLEPIEGTQYYRFSDSEEDVEKLYGLISPEGEVLLAEKWGGIYRLLCIEEQVFFHTWLPDLGLSALYDPEKKTWVFPEAQYTHFTLSSDDKYIEAHKPDDSTDKKAF